MVQNTESKKSVQGVKVLYRTDLYPNLEQLEKNGNFIDLRSAEKVELRAGQYAMISLGVCIELPSGYWGQVVPRSSLFKNHGVIMTNSFGVIDNEYCGIDDIWRMPVYAIRDTVIEENERICQFRIVEDNPICVERSYDASNWNKNNRGGFGSTGR